jgi:hypothetical protein
VDLGVRHPIFGPNPRFGGSNCPIPWLPPGTLLRTHARRLEELISARGCPIVCKRCDLILQDSTRTTVVVDGIVKVEGGGRKAEGV